MRIVYGPYPMTLAQLSTWAKDCDLTPLQCSKAIECLDTPITAIRIRRA